MSNGIITNILVSIGLSIMTSSCIDKETLSGNTIELRILNNNLGISPSDKGKAIVKLELRNPTDDNYILYNFLSLDECLINEEDIKTGDCNSGLGYYIFDSTGNKISPFGIAPEYLNPPTYNDVQESIKSIGAKVSQRAIILNKNSSIFLEIELRSINHYNLLDTHTIYLIYYSGKHLAEYVDADLKCLMSSQLDIKVFMGYLKSNAVNITMK